MSIEDLNLIKLEDYVKSNKNIIGMFYSGSFSRGNSDEFSDIDIEFVVNKKFLDKSEKNIKSLLSKLGKISLVYFLDNKNVKSFIGDFQKVDIKLHSIDNMKPWGKYNSILIVKDHNNLLKDFKLAAQKFKNKVDKKTIDGEFKEALITQIIVTQRCARGWNWVAMDWINFRVQKLFVLYMRMKGKIQFDFANAEKLLNKNEMKLMKDSYCHKPSKKEIKRSLKALWKFTKFVFKNKKFNEKDLMKKVNSTLN